MSFAAPDEALIDRLPLPLAQLARRARNAKTPLEQHLTAYYLWECGLKLLGSAAVVDYAELGAHDPDLVDRLRNLARPAVGHWWEFARRLVPVLADRGVAGYPAVKDLLLGRTRDDLPRAAGLDAALLDVLDGKRTGRAAVQLAELFDRLVRYRNGVIGHAAPGQLGDDFNRRMAEALLAGTAEVLGRLDVLAGRRLVYVESVRPARGVWLVQRYELTGEAARRLEALELPRDQPTSVPDEAAVYLWDPAGVPAVLRPLHPLVLFDPDSAEVLFLNARRGKARADYLCYTTGKVTDRDDLGAERRGLLARVLGLPVSAADESGWAARSAAEDPLPDGPGPPPSRTLGEFELLSELGRGGMGVVYRAWQPSLGRQVALKRLLPTADLSRAEGRFRREIRALGKVEHPHLVKVYTSGSDGDAWYYAMELVEGAPLSAVCEALSARPSAEVDLPTWRASVSTACDKARAAEKPLTGPPAGVPPPPAAEPPAPPAAAPRGTREYVRQVVALMADVADAAHALHEAGVVHRDIKPGNVLVGRDGERSTLMDLGLAQVADEVDGKLTRTRQFVGTLRYASPEQVLAVGAVDRRSDVYSLGATLWELLALHPLFGATDATPTPQLMLDIQQREPERVRGWNRSVGRDLEAVVHRCLEKRADRRYPTAKDLADDLRRVLAGEPVLARPVSRLDRTLKWVRRHPTVSGSAAAVCLALVAGTVVSVAFAIEADRQRDQANANAETARRERDAARASEAAVAARNELAKANAALKEEQDKLLGSTAQRLLGAVAVTGEPWAEPPPLTGREVDAFWEIARNRGTPYGLALAARFVTESARSPTAAEQLRKRAAYTFHAAVGLDPDAREAVDRTLRSALAGVRRRYDAPRDRPTGTGSGDDGLTDPRDDTWAELAVAAPALGGLAPETAAEVALAVATILGGGGHGPARESLGEALAAVAPRLNPPDAAAVAHRLTAALARVRSLHALREVTRGLPAVAPRLDPADAAAVAGQLTVALGRWPYPVYLGPVARGLAAVLARARPADAVPLARVATDRLVAAMGPAAGGPGGEFELAGGLVALAARLDPGDAAARLTAAMARTADSYALRELAEGVAAAAARLDREGADRARGAAADALTAALGQATTPFATVRLLRGLAAVAPQPGPPQAGPADHRPDPLVAIEQRLWAAVEGVTSADNTGFFLRALRDAGVHQSELRKAVDFLGRAGPDAVTPVAPLLLALLSGSHPVEVPRRAAALTLAVGSAGGAVHPLGSPALLRPMLEPLPAPLPPQAMVDALKHPLCVGEARRAVLDALGLYYGRRFVDQ